MKVALPHPTLSPRERGMVGPLELGRPLGALGVREPHPLSASATQHHATQHCIEDCHA